MNAQLQIGHLKSPRTHQTKNEMPVHVSTSFMELPAFFKLFFGDPPQVS
jgi:hypothetical protein